MSNMPLWKLVAKTYMTKKPSLPPFLAYAAPDTIIGLNVKNALRDETPLPNPKLEALRTFTLKMIRDRGNVDDKAVQTFIDARFTKQQVFEVILGISHKVMSNYTNHLAQTAVDAPFQNFAWQKNRHKLYSMLFNAVTAS